MKLTTQNWNGTTNQKQAFYLPGPWECENSQREQRGLYIGGKTTDLDVTITLTTVRYVPDVSVLM